MDFLILRPEREQLIHTRIAPKKQIRNTYDFSDRCTLSAPPHHLKTLSNCESSSLATASDHRQVSEFHQWLQLRAWKICPSVARNDMGNSALQADCYNTRPSVLQPKCSATTKPWVKATTALPSQSRNQRSSLRAPPAIDFRPYALKSIATSGLQRLP